MTGYNNINTGISSQHPLTDLHLVRRFWNQVLTCASVILSPLASAERSADARYFWRWKRFSSSMICRRENDVRGFLRFGGVRFWYGWPTRRATATQPRAVGAHHPSRGLDRLYPRDAILAPVLAMYKSLFTEKSVAAQNTAHKYKQIQIQIQTTKSIAIHKIS